LDYFWFRFKVDEGDDVSSEIAWIEDRNKIITRISGIGELIQVIGFYKENLSYISQIFGRKVISKSQIIL
jgi:predicted DNA-binding protein with PD1-like motif